MTTGQYPKPASSYGPQSAPAGSLGEAPKTPEAVSNKAIQSGGASYDGPTHGDAPAPGTPTPSYAPKTSLRPQARGLAPMTSLIPPSRPQGLVPGAPPSRPAYLGMAKPGEIAGAFQGLEPQTASANPDVSYLRQTESEFGLPSNFLATMWQIESSSSRDPGMNTGTYVGPFQLGPDVAGQYGIQDPTNFKESALGAAQYAAQNAAQLYRVLGRAPTAEELYLAHQQGAAGAAALLTHPDEAAVDVLARFHGDRAARVITANGGSTDMTAGQFAGLWRSRYQQKQQEAARIQGWGSDVQYAMGAPVRPDQTSVTASLGGTSRFDPVSGMIVTS